MSHIEAAIKRQGGRYYVLSSEAKKWVRAGTLQDAMVRLRNEAKKHEEKKNRTREAVAEMRRLGFDTRAIYNALRDGEALATMGLDDSDTADIEIVANEFRLLIERLDALDEVERVERKGRK